LARLNPANKGWRFLEIEVVALWHKRGSYTTLTIHVYLYPPITLAVTAMHPKTRPVRVIGHEYLVVLMVGAKHLFLHALFRAATFFFATAFFFGAAAFFTTAFFGVVFSFAISASASVYFTFNALYFVLRSAMLNPFDKKSVSTRPR